MTSSLFATFLKAPGLHNIFLAGLLTGMLPCGLLYGFVALAASSEGIFAGATMMVAFGLGTAPVMILTGCGGSLLNLAARKYIYQIAAWCVVLTGLISIARGAGFVAAPGIFEAAGCPLCD